MPTSFSAEATATFNGSEPVAADLRSQGDGGQPAFLKLMSVLADVRLAALVQRDAYRRIRRLFIGSASAFVGLVALASLAVMTIEPAPPPIVSII